MKQLILTGLMCLLGAVMLRAEGTNVVTVLTLDAARQLALQNHPRVAAAGYNVAAAQEAVKEARSAELPAANLYATAAGEDSASTRILAGGINNPSVYDRLAGGLAVSQLITDFGRTANLKAGSEYEAQAEHENAADIRQQVWLQVSAGYFNTLEAQAVLKVARETLQTRQLLLEQVGALATNKLKSELDVSFAEVALGESRLLVQKAQNNADAAMAALSNDLGLRNWRQFQLIEPPAPALATNDVEQLIQTALAMRPELLSLRSESDAAHRYALSERDARRPVVSALGVIGNSPLHDDRLSDNYAAADLNVSMPLFSGGLYLAKQRRAEMKAAAADEALRNAEDDVIQDVRVAWLNVNSTLELLQTTEELVHHATEAFELAQSRYQSGLSSIVELTQAQLSLTSAQIGEANAHYELLRQQASLDYQIGKMN